MPRTFGDGVIHMSHCDAMVQGSDPLPELDIGSPTEQENKIGNLVADNLVHDGATLQMGESILKLRDYQCVRDFFILKSQCLV